MTFIFLSIPNESHIIFDIIVSMMMSMIDKSLLKFLSSMQYTQKKQAINKSH